MSKQIAVRLPEDIVEFVDGLIRDGKAGSRAIVVTRALERERRRSIAARDAIILAGAGPDADMDSLADHVANAPLDHSHPRARFADRDAAQRSGGRADRGDPRGVRPGLTAATPQPSPSLHDQSVAGR